MRVVHHPVIVLLLSLVLSTWSEAPAAADASLDRLLEQAAAESPTVRAARARWDMARAGMAEARGLDDPELSVTQWSIPSNFNLSQADETWYGISQAFPFPGTRRLRGRVAEAGAQAAEQEYHAAVRAVRARVKTLYARLYRAQRQIDTHREHRRLIDDLIEAVLARYRSGQATQQESLKAQVELSSLHAGLLTLEQEQQSLRLELNAAIGRPDEPLFFGAAQIVYAPIAPSLDALEAMARDARPELHAADRLVAGRTEAVNVAKRGLWPNLTAEVAYWDVHDGPNRWMLTGRMTLPWLAAGKYRSKIAQARADVMRSEAERDATRQETSFLVRDLFLKVKTSETLIDLYQRGILAQAEQALDSARIAYTAGRADFFTLIDAEQRLRDARLASDLALADWAERRAELERIVGRDLP